MKHTIRTWTAFLLFLAAVAGAGAQDMAFSIGTWSFFRDSAGRLPSGEPGTFASLGATYGLSPRVEAGVALIPRLLPDTFDDLFVEEHIGISLFGERARKSGEPAIYINAILDVGVLFGAHKILSGSPEFSRAFFLRLTPITLGTPYYGRRDRMLSTGLIYDYDSGSASLFMNIIAADFYLASPADVR